MVQVGTPQAAARWPGPEQLPIIAPARSITRKQRGDRARAVHIAFAVLFPPVFLLRITDDPDGVIFPAQAESERAPVFQRPDTGRQTGAAVEEDGSFAFRWRETANWSRGGSSMLSARPAARAAFVAVRFRGWPGESAGSEKHRCRCGEIQLALSRRQLSRGDGRAGPSAPRSQSQIVHQQVCAAGDTFRAMARAKYDIFL